MSSNLEPVSCLRADHLALTQLFRSFSAATARDAHAQEKSLLVEEIVSQLQSHLRTVEEVVWPVVSAAYAEFSGLDKAEMTHQLLKNLSGQLAAMTPDDDLFEARAFILMTLTRQAFEAEECELFPALRSARLQGRRQHLAESIQRQRAGAAAAAAPRRAWPLRMMSGR